LQEYKLFTHYGLARTKFSFKLGGFSCGCQKTLSGFWGFLTETGKPAYSTKEMEITRTYPLITWPQASLLLQSPTSKTPVCRAAQQTPASTMPTQRKAVTEQCKGLLSSPVLPITHQKLETASL